MELCDDRAFPQAAEGEMTKGSWSTKSRQDLLSPTKRHFQGNSRNGETNSGVHQGRQEASQPWQEPGELAVGDTMWTGGMDLSGVKVRRR